MALATLLAVAVVSPWAFGAVQPVALRAVTTIALFAGALALLLAAAQRQTHLPALPAVPALGLLAIVAAQLVPLPPALHRGIARGSYDVWHPADPTVSAVLGAGARPISIDPDTTLRSLAWLFGLLLLAALAAPELARRGAWRVALVIAGNGLALAAFGIWARGHLGARLYGSYAVPTTVPFGPFVSKNHFAGYVALAALLTLGIVIGWTDRRARDARGGATSARAGAVVLVLVAALGMVLSVLVCGSRGGAAALTAGLLAMAAIAVGTSTSWQRLVVPALVCATLAGGVLALLPREAQRRLSTAEGASFRVDVWRDTLRLVAWSPLVGTGLGSFHDAFPRAKRRHGAQRVAHAENEYLELLAETGLLGLGFAVVAAGGLAARGGAGLRQGRPITRGLAIGALAGFVALAAHNLVDFNLRIPSNAALAAVLAAVVAAAAGMRAAPLAPRVAVPGALIALLLLAAVNGRGAPTSTAARERVREAALATTPEARALRLERAEAALRDALATRPGHAEAWLQLAAVRAARGDGASAAALARHAASLDTQRADLREQAEALAR